MKNKYLKASMITSILFFMSIVCYSQDVHFTFANAQNTNDGSNDYYEVDVMIQTINSTGTFKLGSGQLYFNYSAAAFGASLFTSGGFEVSQVNADGYICGQFVDAAAADIYGVFTLADNTPSRLSWSFSQVFSASTFAADNVTSTPTKLCHLKLRYSDVLEEPMLTYDDAPIYTDQFDTACGPAGGPFQSADCGTDPGVVLVNDTFDSAGAVLSVLGIDVEFGVSVYPNPARDIINIQSTSGIESVEMFDLLGKQVLKAQNVEQVKVGHLPNGVYLLKVYSQEGNLTKKVIIE